MIQKYEDLQIGGINLSGYVDWDDMVPCNPGDKYEIPRPYEGIAHVRLFSESRNSGKKSSFCVGSEYAGPPGIILLAMLDSMMSLQDKYKLRFILWIPSRGKGKDENGLDHRVVELKSLWRD